MDHVSDRVLEPFTAYKAAVSSTSNGPDGLKATRVVVTLEVPADARHNMNRAGVVNKATAKHRVDRAIVKDIEDADGNHYASATSAFYSIKAVYNVGHLIVDPNYETDASQVCAAGIHIFNTRRVAEQFEITTYTTGVYDEYYDNGQLRLRESYKDGKRYTLTAFRQDGSVYSRFTYEQGTIDRGY